MSGSDDSLDDSLTSAIIMKAMRKTAKFKFTQEKKKIIAHIRKGDSPQALLVRQENLHTHFDDCVTSQAKYLKKVEEETEEKLVDTWTPALEEEFAATVNFIREYLHPNEEEPEQVEKNGEEEEKDEEEEDEVEEEELVEEEEEEEETQLSQLVFQLSSSTL